MNTLSEDLLISRRIGLSISTEDLDAAEVAETNRDTVGDYTVFDPKITARDVNVFYGTKQAICGVNLDLGNYEVLAMIGPSGCGKSTFLRCLNRMNDTIAECRVSGKIHLDGENIYHQNIDEVLLRARVGMVFQKPNPFPKSIFENVAYGPRLHGMTRDEARLALAEFLCRCLREGRRCVRLIHGKGLGSPGGVGVLKQLSRGWLAQREEILAFCQALPHQGGSGALVILLRVGGVRPAPRSREPAA